MSGTIDVWQIDLAVPFDIEAGLAVLDDAERCRARRFRFPELSRRFVRAHAAVRGILASLLGTTAAAISFDHGPHGKPVLSGMAGPVFSLSHSHELALCAVAGDGDVGVDVEHCRALPMSDLAQRHFAPEECGELMSLAPDRQLQGFFSCWSRKEAYVKAKGLGLSLAFDSFAVSLDHEPRLRYSHTAPEDAQGFRLWDLPVAGGYCAALAYRGAAGAGPCLKAWS